LSTALSMPQALNPPPHTALTSQQKAAIIVRVLLAEDPGISLHQLSGSQQTDLVHQMAEMTHVDQATMISVVEEFLGEFNGTGLSFPGKLRDSLALMSSSISPETTRSIRRDAGLALQEDPWQLISAMDVAVLVPLFENETIEVGAVILSKLKVSTAAEILAKLPGERARRITYAVSQTSEISPDIVRSIGQAIANQFDTHTDLEFSEGPVERVGAILNFSPAATRDDMLEGLHQVDAKFADQVRKAIFTFANIPERLNPRDVPKIIRDIDPAALVTALANYHLPLKTEMGYILSIPDVFVFGNWTAITIAIVFMSLYSRRVSSEMISMSDALAATQMALSREQKLTDLGGVVAATAHELGTPLATIKLASTELIDELGDRPELCEDAALIRQQADRCGDILRDMGRAGKDDLHLRQAPLITLIEEAAEPHMNRGKTILFESGPGPGGDAHQPSVLRLPEVVHGLRNLIQNAVDFSRANVWVEATWSDAEISVRILDDGRGYPPHLIGRIGDPFMRARRSDSERGPRPEYEGMGLGLFIAKTLLERSGAELSFANGSDPYQSLSRQKDRRGAIVEVVWPRRKIDAQHGENAVPLGANRPIEI